MHVEVSVALNFVLSYLYNKLPRRRVDCFGEELEKGVKRKFSGHWYPDTPQKGSAFRCLKVSGAHADPVVEQAAVSSGLEFTEILEFIPAELNIWVDPGEVSYKIGEKGQARILLSERNRYLGVEQELQFPEAQMFRPIVDSLSSSLNNLRVSPVHEASPARSWGSPSPSNGGSSPVTRYNQRQQQQQTFTAASFAATKFGSTKLKSSHAKRPTRLSPTDLNGGVARQQPHGTLLPNNWMYGVGAVSPASGLSPIGPVAPAFGGEAQRSYGLPSPGFSNGMARPASPRDQQLELIEYQKMLLAHHYQLQQLQQQQAAQEKLQRAYSTGGFSSPPPVDNDTTQELGNGHHNSFASLAHLNSIYGNPAGPLANQEGGFVNSPSNASGRSLSPTVDGGFGPIGSGRRIKGQGHGEGNMPRAYSPISSSENEGQNTLGFSDNTSSGGWSPYASLQHLLVAN